MLTVPEELLRHADPQVPQQKLTQEVRDGIQDPGTDGLWAPAPCSTQGLAYSWCSAKVRFQAMNVLLTQSCPTLCDPWTVAHQAPLSMEFSRQEYWSGLSFPSPGDLPVPGIKPGSPALQADSLPSEPPRKPE